MRRFGSNVTVIDRNGRLLHREDDDVTEALGRVNLSGMTVIEVRGHGKQKGHTTVYRGQEYNISLLPKMQIETLVADDLVDAAVTAIIKAARTGESAPNRPFGTAATNSPVGWIPDLQA